MNRSCRWHSVPMRKTSPLRQNLTTRPAPGFFRVATAKCIAFARLVKTSIAERQSWVGCRPTIESMQMSMAAHPNRLPETTSGPTSGLAFGGHPSFLLSLAASFHFLSQQSKKIGTSINHVAYGDQFSRTQTLVTHMMSLYAVPADACFTDASCALCAMRIAHIALHIRAAKLRFTWYRISPITRIGNCKNKLMSQFISYPNL